MTVTEGPPCGKKEILKDNAELAYWKTINPRLILQLCSYFSFKGRKLFHLQGVFLLFRLENY